MTNLKQTALFDLYAEHGGKIVPFAGYEMPVQFSLGVMGEHLHTRTQAGLFDVSHMGQVFVTAKSGDIRDAGTALERLLPIDVIDLPVNEQRYAVMLNADGGVIDDLMVTRQEDRYLLVVNGAVADTDVAHILSIIGEDCIVDWQQDRGMVALQGPMAETALNAFAPVSDMIFMQGCMVQIDGREAWVSRSGYTGEDGFEISANNADMAPIVKALLAHDAVKFIGLGARDSLRLEAGMCLSGQDIDASRGIIDAVLLWSISKVRRPDGARAGGYVGAVKTEADMAGTPRKRVGIMIDGRAPMRTGIELFASDTGGKPIGIITSGGFGPTVGSPIAMGYIDTSHKNVGTQIFGEVRGKRLPCTIAKLPFTQNNFKRS